MYNKDDEVLGEYDKLFAYLHHKISEIHDNIKAEEKILEGIEDREIEYGDRVYTLYESANYIDKEEKFDKFKDGLSNILHYMVELWDKNHQGLNSFNSLELLIDFFIQIINRLLKYNMYRLYRIMTIYQADNIIMTPNFIGMMDDIIEELKPEILDKKDDISPLI